MTTPPVYVNAVAADETPMKFLQVLWHWQPQAEALALPVALAVTVPVALHCTAESFPT